MVQIESKHFEKSKYTASISHPLSIISVQWSNVAKSWVMHERPLIKPCWQEVSRLLLTIGGLLQHISNELF